jgi:hypothetical protein
MGYNTNPLEQIFFGIVVFGISLALVVMVYNIMRFIDLLPL